MSAVIKLDFFFKYTFVRTNTKDHTFITLFMVNCMEIQISGSFQFKNLRLSPKNTFIQYLKVQKLLLVKG